MGCDGLVGFARFVLAGGRLAVVLSSALYFLLGVALWGVLGRIIDSGVCLVRGIKVIRGDEDTHLVGIMASRLICPGQTSLTGSPLKLRIHESNAH